MSKRSRILSEAPLRRSLYRIFPFHSSCPISRRFEGCELFLVREAGTAVCCLSKKRCMLFMHLSLQIGSVPIIVGQDAVWACHFLGSSHLQIPTFCQRNFEQGSFAKG
ncbi:hypothetical protein SCHPADRAFT_16595 [Schizopora paradoxa]|uniref:Uncharacterized protein n=1 Tax=Schizopora paradoxa TaxID=27342 RepID=A0A0H2S8V8_9AGAM|nr:hypothetical protein SCHPADRAFT_16595 [Schizopora paradoxa]